MNFDYMRSERGDSKLYGTIAVILVFVLVVGMWKFGIPLFKNMVISNYARKIVNYDTENERLDYSLMRSMYDKVYNRAVDLNLPVKEKDVIVDREDNRAVIKIKYTIPVNLFVTTIDLNFNTEKRSEGVALQ